MDITEAYVQCLRVKLVIAIAHNCKAQDSLTLQNGPDFQSSFKLLRQGKIKALKLFLTRLLNKRKTIYFEILKIKHWKQARKLYENTAMKK